MAEGQSDEQHRPREISCVGSVVLPEFVKVMQGGSWEGWSRDASAELADLLAHIEEHDIRGVIFGSGDLHLGYLLRRPPTALDNDRQGPDYWELASSPLANAHFGL